jgi:hypothetical protein
MEHTENPPYIGFGIKALSIII